MQIDTREIGNTLLLDLSGPYPAKYNDEIEIEERFREALSGCDDFIIVIHQADLVEAKHLAFLLMWLHKAGHPVCGLGLGPYVKIVADSDRLPQIVNVVDSSFRVYLTEEEALAASA